MNKSGFSLVQTLIFSAILSVVTLVLVALTTYSSQMIIFIRAKINEYSLAQTVNDQLKDLTTCTAALSGQIFNPALATATTYPPAPPALTVDLTNAATPFKLFPGAALYPTSTAPNMPEYDFDVVDLAFLNASTLAASAPTNAGDDVYEAQLWIRLNIHSQSLGPQALAPLQLGEFAVFRNRATSKIDSCQPIKQFVMAACAAASVPSIYLPTGYTNSQGTNFPPDANGCVSLAAFDSQRVGPTGPRGQQINSTGPQGGVGPIGPRGTPGSLIYVPAPTPPKSDRRVKMGVTTFLGRSQTPGLSQEVFRMQMIRALQRQQTEIEFLQKQLGN